MASRQRPDGRRRFAKDKGLIGLALAAGEDPADPVLRPRMVATWLGLGFDRGTAEQIADDHIADLHWGKAGFPLV
jgi:hypothetical protein